MTTPQYEPGSPEEDTPGIQEAASEKDLEAGSMPSEPTADLDSVTDDQIRALHPGIEGAEIGQWRDHAASFQETHPGAGFDASTSTWYSPASRADLEAGS